MTLQDCFNAKGGTVFKGVNTVPDCHKYSMVTSLSIKSMALEILFKKLLV